MAVSGGWARPRRRVGHPANSEPDGATRATRAPTGGTDAKRALPDRILGPPWPLLAAGGLVPQAL